jgi:hypothetical protein
MSQEPEKKETNSPADRFNKVNRKMTIVWTGVAVLVVLAIALGIFFASKGNAKQPEGSGSMEGTVIINDDGQKVLVDEDGKEIPGRMIDYTDVPSIVGIVWAMARAAGSTKLSFAKFRQKFLESSSNYSECEEVFDKLLFGLAQRAFFRRQDGPADAQ